MKELRWLREEPKSNRFCFFSFFFSFWFYIMCFVLINYWEQRLRGALAMVKKNRHPLLLSTPIPGKKPSTQVSLVRDQLHTSHAKEELKLRLQGRNKKHQINTWRGINRKALAIDTNKVNNE